MPAGPENPGIDTARIARIYAALAGSPWADAAEREAIAKDAHPGMKAARERIRGARQYHSAAALKAVTRGIRSVVFGAPGLPASEPARRGTDQVPDPHEAAIAAVPDARFTYADADEEVAKINDAVFGRCGHVAVCVASLRDPEGLLACPEVADLPGPLHLQAQMSVHFWPPDLAQSLHPRLRAAAARPVGAAGHLDAPVRHGRGAGTGRARLGHRRDARLPAPGAGRGPVARRRRVPGASPRPGRRARAGCRSGRSGRGRRRPGRVMGITARVR